MTQKTKSKYFVTIFTVLILSTILLSSGLNFKLSTEKGIFEEKENQNGDPRKATIIETTDFHNYQPTHSLTMSDIYIRSSVVAQYHNDLARRIVTGGRNATGLYLSTWIIHESPFDIQFEYAQFIQSGTNNYVEPLLAYDFDGDGRDEILAQNYGSATFFSWTGEKFEEIWTDRSSLISLEYNAELFDIDQDGIKELITSSPGKTQIFSWGDGFTNFHKEAELAGGTYYRPGLGDLDGDGIPELVTEKDQNILVYSFDGTDYVVENSYPFTDPGYSGFVIADLDQNGQNECYGGMYNYGVSTYPFSMFTWDGVNFNREDIVQHSGAFFDIQARDIDNDGYPEILTAVNGDFLKLIEFNQNDETIFGTTSFSTDILFTLADLNSNFTWDILGQNVYEDFTVPERVVDFPSVPNDLLGEAGDNQVKLNWKSPSSDGGWDISYYNIYRSTTSGSNFELIKETDNLGYIDKAVENGNEYFYKVAAVNPRGEGLNTSQIGVYPLASVDDTTNDDPTGDDDPSNNGFVNPFDIPGYSSWILLGISFLTSFLLLNKKRSQTHSDVIL